MGIGKAAKRPDNVNSYSLTPGGRAIGSWISSCSIHTPAKPSLERETLRLGDSVGLALAPQGTGEGPEIEVEQQRKIMKHGHVFEGVGGATTIYTGVWKSRLMMNQLHLDLCRAEYGVAFEISKDVGVCGI